MSDTLSLATGAALLDLYPKLSGLAKVPAFIAAIADDRWLTEEGPYLRLPDFLANEDNLWEAMVNAIPELAAFDLAPPQGGMSDAANYRRKTRRAAVRTIACACNLGAPTFSNHPHLGGDPSVPMQAGGGLACRVGEVLSVAWKPTPTLLERTLSALNRAGATESVERAIFPLVETDDYDAAFARWRRLAPLREWDDHNRLPLIGVRSIMSVIPTRYVERYTEADLSGAEIPFRVAAQIVSPYAADIVRDLRNSAGASPRSADALILWAINRCGR